MKKYQIAAQLFTVAAFLKTPEDIAKSLKKIKEIGYDTVQVSGMGPFPEADLMAICRDNGLAICATHEPGGMICDEPQKVIDRLDALSCRYTAYPWPHIMPQCLADVRELAAKLENSAKLFEKAGKKLCYHNHDIEFERFDGVMALEEIYRLAPSLGAEIDTFWAQAGGVDVLEWVERMAGRMPIFHLKDYCLSKRTRVMTPIGEGNINWKRIIPAAERGGVEYFIVEQDNCNGENPFEALRRSYEYLFTNFVEK